MRKPRKQSRFARTDALERRLQALQAKLSAETALRAIAEHRLAEYAAKHISTVEGERWKALHISDLKLITELWRRVEAAKGDTTPISTGREALFAARDNIYRAVQFTGAESAELIGHHCRDVGVTRTRLVVALDMQGEVVYSDVQLGQWVLFNESRCVVVDTEEFLEQWWMVPCQSM